MSAIPRRLPEPRPVLVAAGDLVSRGLRPRNLAYATVAAVLAVWLGGAVGIVLGVLAAPFLLGVGARTAWRYTGRGRTRLNHGHRGWATRRELAETRPTGPSTRLGSTTVGPPVPIPLRVGHDDSVLILGGPRRGKTLTLADIVRQHRARGPRYISSTRTDLLRATISARRHGEAPAWVFIPEGVDGAMGRLIRLMVQAGWVRLMHWSPVAGCEDPLVAANRAAALIEAIDTGSPDDQTWLQSATTVLRCLLQAAALGGRDMATVYRWVIDPSETRVPFDILQEHDVTAAAEYTSEIIETYENAASSVLRMVRQATEYMANPNVAAACCPGPGDEVLDMREFIESDGDLYVIGRERKRQGTQPLVAALLAELWDTAVALANKQENGKLPRALLLAADELAVTARVPWDDWLATAGGSGIHMVGVAQSPRQLDKKWPKNAILDNSTSVLVFGGLKGENDLRGFTTLCGKRWESVPQEPSRHVEQPVMTEGRLSGLRKFRALHLGGHLAHPTILGTARWVKVHEVTGTLRAAAAGATAVARAQITAPQRQALPVAAKAPIPLPPATQHAHATRKAS